jgi:outer membrane lipoprotein LolB
MSCGPAASACRSKASTAQSFSASFELKGKPEQGELSLISPLGSVLGVLRWSPGEAVLDSGNGKIQRFLRSTN